MLHRPQNVINSYSLYLHSTSRWMSVWLPQRLLHNLMFSCGEGYTLLLLLFCCLSLNFFFFLVSAALVRMDTICVTKWISLGTEVSTFFIHRNFTLRTIKYDINHKSFHIKYSNIQNTEQRKKWAFTDSRLFFFTFVLFLGFSSIWLLF